MRKTLRVCIDGKTRTLPVTIESDGGPYIEISVKKKRWELLHTASGLQQLVEDRIEQQACRDPEKFWRRLLPKGDNWLFQVRSPAAIGTICTDSLRELGRSLKKRLDIRYCLMSDELRHAITVSNNLPDTMWMERVRDEFYRYPPVDVGDETRWPALVVVGGSRKKMTVTTDDSDYVVELRRLWGGRPILVSGDDSFVVFGKEKPSRLLLRRMETYEKLVSGSLNGIVAAAASLAFGKMKLYQVLGTLAGLRLMTVGLNRAAAEACLVTPEGDLTEVWALADSYS